MDDLLKRRYDIGHGVTIIDDGWSLRAEWSVSGGISSVGVVRPRPPQEKVSAIYSVGRRHFYIDEYAAQIRPHGFWLGCGTWDDLDKMQLQQRAGIEGKAYAEFCPKDGSPKYFRELMPFAYWSVTAERTPVKTDASDLAVRDYISLCQNHLREDERRFNEAIEFTERDLRWLLNKIGPWVPVVPSAPPVVTLQD